MKNFFKFLAIGFIAIIVIGIFTDGEDEAKASTKAKASVTKPINEYDGTTKYACRHFKSLIANADVTTYQEQLKELKTVYTGMAIAYEDGNYQSGPMYHAARTVYSAAIDNNFTDEAMKAMTELTVLCSSVPNW
jgi:hypothetical protein